MRYALLVLAFLVAGCFSGSPGKGAAAGPDPSLGLSEFHEDNLTARLHPDSGAFYVEPWTMDVLELPGGGTVSLLLGRGVHCAGNATSIAPGKAGWATCSLRPVAAPSLQATDRRALDIGFDSQRMTLLSPAEPMEWRFEVVVAAADPPVSFDSGWRAVDFSPVATAPQVVVSVLDACDTNDLQEDATMSKSGAARVNVSFASQRSLVNISLSLAGSQAGEGTTADPFAHGSAADHSFQAIFPLRQDLTPMWLNVSVDLETNATASPAATGPCAPALAQELQHWSVLVEYAGADAVRRSFEPIPLDVDVYLVAA